MELKELQVDLQQRLDDKIGGEVGKVTAEFKAAFEDRLLQIEKNGVVLPETKEKIERLFSRMDTLEAQWSRADGKGQAHEGKAISDQISGSNIYKDWSSSQFRTKSRIRVPIEGTLFDRIDLKYTPIADSGLTQTTTGVLGITRIPGMISVPRRELRIRDLIPVFQMTTPVVDWLRQTGFTSGASPQVETQAKAESTITWDTQSTGAKTIAHWIKVTTQALADMPQLRADIDDLMMFGLKLKEEDEILTGSGSGQHLNGIVTQATAYNTAYNITGDTKLDKVRHAILQARLALYPVDGLVLNPRDLHDIELIKNEAGAANSGFYIVGDPKVGTALKYLWGKPVVESDAIPYGFFLTGAFALGARLFDRLEAVIDISLEDSDNFEKNLATIRCEERVALAVLRPASFVYGAF